MREYFSRCSTLPVESKIAPFIALEAMRAGATNASYGTSLPPTLTVPTRSPRPARMLSR